MMSPCKNCLDRKLHCHSTCEKYIAFRKELDSQNRQLHLKTDEIAFDVIRTTRLKKRSKK